MGKNTTKKSTTPTTNHSLIPQGEVKDERVLSHAERIFKFRMQRLSQIKRDIDNAKNQIDTARQKVRKDIMPIIDRIALQKFEFIRILDEAYEKQFFTLKQKEKIRELIEEKAHQLLYQYRFEPAQKIYKKYVKHNREQEKGVFGTVNEAAYDFAQAVNDLLFNWEKKEENESNTKKFEIDEEKDKTKENEKKITFHEDENDVNSPKILDTTQFVRMLYTKLAKELHPDLEQDEAQKTFKNQLMQRLTASYKKQDLYDLLQIQVEYSTNSNPEKLAEEQLQIVNETLLNQIKSLQEEYKDLTLFSEDAILYRQFGGNPDVMDIKIARHKEELVMELLELKDELQVLLNKEKLEQFLQNQDRRPESDMLRW